MTLRQRTALIVGLTLIGLVTILYFVSRGVLISGYQKLEQQNTKQNLQRVQSALEEELNRLSRQTNDYAMWDDSYDFVLTLNTEYTPTNFPIETFVGTNINIAIITDNEGKVLFQSNYDPTNEQLQTIPESLLRQLTTDSILINHTSTESQIAGFILLPEGPLMLASRPIRTSLGEGPIVGSMIFGRYLDEAGMTWLSQLTNLSITLATTAKAEQLVDFQKARRFLSINNPSYIQPIDSHTISGYLLLSDIHDNPAFILRIDLPRGIYQQGIASLNYLVISLVLVSLVASLVTLVLLNYQIINPLSRLSREAIKIGLTEAFANRILVKGHDELASLAKAINGLLESLERHTRAVEHSFDPHRRLAQYQSAAEVARIITGLLSQKEILEQVPVLLHNQFELYFIGVFLTDKQGRIASLRSSTSAMLREGYQLTVGGASTTGWAIAYKLPRIGQKTSQTDEFQIIRLPLSQTELSLPLICQNQVLGALTIQSTQPDAFDNNDISIFQVIASSIAIALYNASHLGGLQKELDDIKSLYQQYIQRSWSEVAQHSEKLSYTFEDQSEITDNYVSHPVQIPIELHGQQIGNIELEINKPELSPQELNLVEAITSEAAGALENIRLLEDTQRRAERERLLTEISRAVRSSTDIEVILKTAIRELSRSLHAAQGEIQLEAVQKPPTPERKNDANQHL